MNDHVKMAFRPEVLSIPLECILSLRQMKPGLKKSNKYRRILASVREVGVIEPLIVYPVNDSSRTFYLLDGHFRLEALKDVGSKDATCLVSTDDEAFTYNHKVNRLSPIQEHYMILKAIENGVSEERIATALNVDIASIKKKRNLLDGICPEATELLKDKQVTKSIFQVLKKMKPMRQIEAAELMVASNNYTHPYVLALFFATKSTELVNPKTNKSTNSVSQDDILRIEREMEFLEKDFKRIQNTYGHNIIQLTVARGYIQKIVTNRRVASFLQKHYPDIFEGFGKIIQATSLEQTNQENDSIQTETNLSLAANPI